MNNRSFFVDPEVEHALGQRGYPPPKHTKIGLRYIYNGSGVFYFYYHTTHSLQRDLPEIHILPTNFKDESEKCKAMMKEFYKNYLRNIGKSSFVPNVIILPRGHGLQIKQPTRDYPNLESMTWKDIKDVVLNLHLVHHDAPRP